MANFEVQNQKTIIARIEKITEIVKETIEVVFTFDDETFSFKSGQYIWVELLKLNFPDHHGSRRAFSIVSDPETKNKISVIFRKSESGYKRTLVSLSIGSEVHLIGPCGSVILQEDINKPAVFVAGGTSIAPFFSIISHEINQKTGRKLELFYFNTSEESAPYLNELRNFEKENQSFKLHLFFYILKNDDEIVLNYFEDTCTYLKNADWYISGPEGMVDVVSEIISKIKIPDESIHYEEHYPSLHIELKDDKYFEKLEMFKLAVDQSSNHIIFTDENGIIKFANSSAERMTGYSINEMIGQTSRLWGGLMGETFYKSLWDTIKIKHQPFVGKIKNRKKNGSYYFSLTRISPLISPEGELLGFVGTEEDITELENIDRTKTEFISLASHQLRTPVTALNWYLEILQKKEENENISDEFKKYIEEIYTINRNMIHLVNTLLDASHIELGNTTIHPIPVDMVETAKAIILELKPEIKKKGIIVVEKYEEKLPLFVTDPKIAGIIFQNLLTNALKYIPSIKKGEIDISINTVKKGSVVELKTVPADSLLITVKDNGIGIPSNQSDKIFSRMFRADNARDGVSEGSGLGLYIVKKNIDLISGDIWFMSEVGKGTTFYVLLPFSISNKKEV